MTPIEWAQAYKKRIAREFVRRTSFESSPTPSGIFTAGLPGAGKTEFTVELLKGLDNRPLRIDMDEIASLIEGYKPQIADKFRAGASIILSKIYDETIKAHIDFVFDGTFSYAKALENVERALNQSYIVKLYYIHQDPIIAWNFTKDRELVEHRAIDKAGFCDTYFKLHDNLNLLMKTHKDVTISLIIKDENNKVGQRVENVQDVYSHLPPLLSRDDIDRVII